MNTYIISYDLIKPGKDYADLIAHIKTHTWAYPLKSVWLIKSSLTAEQVRNAARVHMDTNDKIVVIDVTGRAAAWANLPQDVSTWIQSHL